MLLDSASISRGTVTLLDEGPALPHVFVLRMDPLPDDEGNASGDPDIQMYAADSAEARDNWVRILNNVIALKYGDQDMAVEISKVGGPPFVHAISDQHDTATQEIWALVMLWSCEMAWHTSGNYLAGDLLLRPLEEAVAVEQ